MSTKAQKSLFYPAVLLILLLLLLNTFLLTSTRFGLTSIIWAINAFTQHSIQIVKINGSLFKGVNLTQITYYNKNNSLALAADSLAFKLPPAKLLTATLNIAQIEICNLDIKFPALHRVIKQNFLTKLSGNLSFNYLTSNWEILIDNLTGTWQNLPVLGHVNLTYHKALVAIEALHLKIGQNIINLKKNQALTWLVHIKQLGDLLPTMQGSIYSEGKMLLPNSPNAWTEPLNFSLTAQDLKFKQQLINQLTINVNGNFAKHTINLNLANHQQLQANLIIDASLSMDKIWQGNIKDLIIKSKSLPTLQLVSTCPVFIKQQELTFSNLILTTPNQEVLNISAKFDPQTDSNIDFKLIANTNNYLTGKIQIYDLLNEQLLTGNLNLTVQDLSWIMQLFPNITRLKGQIHGQALLAGSLADPQFNAEFNLDHGTLRIPTLGIKIKPLTIQVLANNTGKFIVNGHGTMRDGPGTVKLTGNFEPFKPGFPNNFTLFAEGMEFINNNQANLIADANLKLILKNLNTLLVNGNIKIISGKINLDDLTNEQHLINSKDIEFHDTKPIRSKSDLNIIPTINLRIEKNVLFKGFGLDAEISGKLDITKPGQHLLGNGRVSIKTGTYQLPGQTLYISHGRLLFAPGTLLSNPSLDIMMTTNKQNSEEFSKPSKENIGIYISGTVNKPKLQNNGLVNSNQALGQILNASSSPLVSKLQNKLALEQFGIEGDEHDEHRAQNKLLKDKNTPTLLDNKNLVIGKKLSQKIYLQYLKSLMDNNNAVRLKYALGKNWAVGVESGTSGHGADLSFSMHKN